MASADYITITIAGRAGIGKDGIGKGIALGLADLGFAVQHYPEGPVEESFIQSGFRGIPASKRAVIVETNA